MAFDMLFVGRDLEEPGSRLLAGWEDRVAWGASPGIPRPWSFKTDPNEDAAAVVVRDGTVVAAVADGHWGNQASERAIRAVHRAALAAPEADLAPRGLLLEAVREVSAMPIQETPGEGTSPSILGPPATAALVAVSRRGRIEIGWMGDCRAFLFSRRSAEALIETDSNWLCRDSALEALEELDSGPMALLPWAESSRAAERGELLLVATDGLVEPVYGQEVVSVTDLASWIALDGSLMDSGERLLGEALRTDRVHGDDVNRGGEDNVTFVLVRL